MYTINLLPVSVIILVYWFDSFSGANFTRW